MAAPNSDPPNFNNHASMPFWDFIQSLDANTHHGAGVDHNPQGWGPGASTGFPFGGPHVFHSEWTGPFGGRGGWGRRGCRGRRFRRDQGMSDREEPENRDANMATDNEKGDMEGDDSETMRDSPDGPPEQPNPHPHPLPHRHRHAHHWHGGRRGHHHGPHGFHHPPPPPPPLGSPPQGPFPVDFGNMWRGFANHPWAQHLRNYAEQMRGTDSESFAPPVDIFNTEQAFVLHVALPGAKKEDIGVNWDADKSTLNVAGVVHRPGDEEFLQSLSSSERKVGMFERNIILPPADTEEKDEIDGMGISAKMEDGVLIINVPKVEKEWTEVRKVDIE